MKTSVLVFLAMMLLLLGLQETLGENKRPLEVVPSVDFSLYAGLWHEIARLPNRFQARCLGEVTAHYTLRSDGKIDVLNRCRVADGTFIEARGLARRAGDDKPLSMLKVRFAPAILSFIPQVWGDYQILALSPDYSHAVIGAPSREYLWILARSPRMDPETYRSLVEQARVQGFDVDRLQRAQ
jgi:apolipoprotein D and lipocalin family protein